ncbi:dynactin subunit 6 [Eurytemora carolleeae]|uniref:dynactin subunit 6 n=1 Tax=Eurytemora carolleeae TaxID=1294199 RepID=UPI000C759F0B|nr:dynactin subunit 6 [Eurytemora carolleeae]|eukprot:XP_023321861.1 dynactin subunit 6-like [Eurytemora affinis]
MSAKSNIKIALGAVVCNECDLRGDITIGAKTVIHPKARIIAEAGPIIIGENNLIEEQCEIMNVKETKDEDEDGSESGNTSVMIIGNNNVFEVGSEILSLRIGDNNVVESKSSIGRLTNLSNGCIVGAGCRLTTEETLEENIVVYGGDCRRRKAGDKPVSQILQIDFLSKVLPNYHHLKKPAKKA